jgi:hypothetical protein
MRTASPWWVSLAFGVGLFCVFLGERVFGGMPDLRVTVTGLGVVTALAVIGVRTFTTLGSRGARRQVERTLLLCHLASLLALILYAATTAWGKGVLGLHLSTAGAARYDGALAVLWAIIMLVSLVPLLLVELSIGLPLRTSFDLAGGGDDEGVESFRVRDLGWSGLSVALATSLLFVTCQVATSRNVQKNVSYFKTASPGDSSQNIVKSWGEPVRVLLFFPQVNEVKEQVRGYFDALREATGKVVIEEHDRYQDAELAGKYKVSKDGTIVIVRGAGDKEKTETIDVDPDIAKARDPSSKLRTFDREVNGKLMKLARDKRRAYLTVGHGEINDPESVPAELKAKAQERRVSVLRRRLGELNYEIKDLSLMDLSRDVPDDATMVLLLGPSIALQPAELAALDRYLGRGGRMMIALDPKGDGTLGPLEGRLGLRYNRASLTDDRLFLPQRGTAADHRFVETTSFSNHASTTSLSKSVGKPMFLVDAGSLEDAPFTPGGTAPTKTYTIKSMDSSFLDLNDNYLFDEGEQRGRYNLAAAIEGPKVKAEPATPQGAGSGSAAPPPTDKDGFRALVFADADLFTDAIVGTSGGQLLLLVAEAGGQLGAMLDAIRWVGGEEVFSGEPVTEEDKPIQHTKNQDSVWFTLTIVGFPLLVLTLGLVGTWARRRRAATKKVTP